MIVLRRYFTEYTILAEAAGSYDAVGKCLDTEMRNVQDLMELYIQEEWGWLGIQMKGAIDYYEVS